MSRGMNRDDDAVISIPGMDAGHDANAILHRLWQNTGLADGDRPADITIAGDDPVVPSRNRIGTASAVALAMSGASSAAIWKHRTGEQQRISVDMRDAAVPGLQAIMFSRIGKHPMALGPITDEEVNFFPTADGRRIYLWRLPIYPHLASRLMRVLGCGVDAPSIAKAAAQWNGEELETAMAEAGAIAVLSRSADEWRAHPQGRWLAQRPLIDIERIDDGSPPAPFAADADQPLSGIRILDCTHVIAGPTSTAVLAGDGADVLRITKPWFVEHPALTLGTGMGKRSAVMDFALDDDIAAMQELARTGDVLVQSWRPGALDRKGLGFEQLAEARPGIVYVSISCYGSEGPWRTRGGFEQLGQTACGLAAQEGTPDEPKLASTGTLNDYLVAYLAAAGAKAALLRRACEGGSYHVRISLARASMFVQELGMVPEDRRSLAPEKLPMPSPDHFFRMTSPYGELTLAAPPVTLSATPLRWSIPPVPPGYHAARWLDR